MGTWDVGIWDNDAAADWIGELAESRGLDLLHQSLSPREVNGYYLEAPEGARVLCSVDTLLAALGLAGSSAPESVLNWISAHTSLDFRALIPEALEMTRRVTAEHSELRELWQENVDLFPTWLARVEGLIASLGPRQKD